MVALLSSDAHPIAEDRHLPKKSNTESRQDSVLEVEMDRVGKQASTQFFTTFDISFQSPNWSD